MGDPPSIRSSELPGVLIRGPRDEDRLWVEQQLRASWGSTTIVSRGRAHDAARLPAFIAVTGEGRLGLATFHFAGGDCELVTLDALEKRRGIGSGLLASVVHEATERGCRRLWLITTNDNLDALRFYQRRGMRLAALHRGAVDEARATKPSIPATGDHGIPIHDELELELRLN